VGKFQRHHADALSSKPQLQSLSVIGVQPVWARNWAALALASRRSAVPREVRGAHGNTPEARKPEPALDLALALTFLEEG